jgi:hypothetical protein
MALVTFPIEFHLNSGILKISQLAKEFFAWVFFSNFCNIYEDTIRYYSHEIDKFNIKILNFQIKKLQNDL